MNRLDQPQLYNHRTNYSQQTREIAQQIYVNNISTFVLTMSCASAARLSFELAEGFLKGEKDYYESQQ